VVARHGFAGGIFTRLFTNPRCGPRQTFHRLSTPTAGSLLLFTGVMALSARPPAARAQTQPNILVVVTDDQSNDSLVYLNRLRNEMAEKGVVFTQGISTTPLCACSRSSILTGKYVHNTGVINNGSYARFDASDTIAIWFHNQGYKTALFGKYINGFGDHGTSIAPPPGWDRWFSFTGPEFSPVGNFYYNYGVSDDGRALFFGNQEADYSTTVLSSKLDEFILRAERPWLAYFAPFAPHQPAIPEDKYIGAFQSVAPFRPENFEEADLTGKPQYIINHALLVAPRVITFTADVDMLHERRLETLLSVEDALTSALDILGSQAQLENTIIVWISDNGFSLGSHWWADKRVPYNESTNVPFMIRWDGHIQPSLVGSPALNIDLGPTIAYLAGVQFPSAINGRPLLDGTGQSIRRLHGLIEYNGDRVVPGYAGVVSGDRLTSGATAYWQYDDGFRELYRMDTDPDQLVNIADDPLLLPTVRGLERIVEKLEQE
jgi:arylsulfatase A-like enzyme